MKIALIQINPLIGDFQGNIAKILTWAGKAREQGCDLAVFPEMVISGYPPLDLLERHCFLEDHDAAFQQLVSEVKGIGLLCGLMTRHTGRTGKPLHNSAALIHQGRVELLHKRLLPTYDVFDEARYFEPGKESRILEFKGLKLGITICEDIFNEPDLVSTLLSSTYGELDRPKLLYRINPLDDLAGADLLINIAASPFQSGKPAAKKEFFCNLAARRGLPILYSNQVGGQDSLIFEGQSLAVDQKGEVIGQAAPFREDMLLIDTGSWQQGEGPDNASGQTAADCPDPDAAEIFEALVVGTRDYLTKCGFKRAIIGLSGGIDSALVAAIAAHALGPKQVTGLTLPSPYSSAGSRDDSRSLAANLGIDFHDLPIVDIFETYLATLAPFFKGTEADVTEQNIQARIRGNLLMALANKFGALLLSTGNKSEMAVGYCTLYGDMSGGLAVISDVPKTMVYRVCRYLNREKEVIPWATIDKPPSAELAPDQKDQDDLPPYEVLDPILQAYLEENKGIKEIVAQGFERPVVEDVVRRLVINEHKRKQAPMGLKVTSKAFGYGRRYPTTQKYTESE